MSSRSNSRNGFNENLIEEFRANGGTVTGMFARTPLILLTTTGRRTGARHTTPLAHTTDGEALVVIASKGGAPTNPLWFENLVANPTATVERGTEKFEVTARVAQGEERDRLYANQAALMPAFAEYERKTPRKIPVVVLERTP